MHVCVHVYTTPKFPAPPTPPSPVSYMNVYFCVYVRACAFDLDSHICGWGWVPKLLAWFGKTHAQPMHTHTLIAMSVVGAEAWRSLSHPCVRVRVRVRVYK